MKIKVVLPITTLLCILAATVSWSAPQVKEYTLPVFKGFPMRPRISGDWVVSLQNDTNKGCGANTKGILCYNLVTKETYTVYEGLTGWCDVRDNVATWTGKSGNLASFCSIKGERSGSDEPSNLIILDLATWKYYNPPLQTGPAFAPAVSGPYAAYEGKGGYIYLIDLITGRQKRISGGKNKTSGPQICGDLVIWEEYANKRQIKGYSISHRQEFPITSEPGGEFYGPHTDGITVVWYDKNNQIWAYDVATGNISKVADGFYPDIAGGIVVYMKSNLGVYGTDLRDGKEFRISSGTSSCGPSMSMGRVIWHKDNKLTYAELSFK